MSAKHTPGPWTVVDDTYDGEGRCFKVDGPTQDDGLVCGYSWFNKADACLIAAAPDLLSLLEECVETLDNYSDVLDGDDGQPRPNRAMSMMTEIERLLARIEGKAWP